MDWKWNNSENMQMLIYLFAVCENGKDRFVSPVPAGVLYLPAKTIEDGLARNADLQAFWLLEFAK